MISKNAQISRTEMYLINQMTTSNYVDALKDARHVVEESCLYPEPFAFSTIFIFSEQVKNLARRKCPAESVLQVAENVWKAGCGRNDAFREEHSEGIQSGLGD